MSKIADAEANATSLDGLVNDNGLIPTLRNGPKPSYQYLVDGWNTKIQSSIFDLNKSRGFRVVGSFTDGFTYELFNDVGIDANGNSWIYVGVGAPNKVVSAGTDPAGDADYEQVTFNEVIADLIAHKSDPAAHPELSAFITSEADRAELAADAADAAASISQSGAMVYASTADGLSGTVSGDYFWVLSDGNEVVFDLYLNSAGVATDTGKRLNKGVATVILENIAENQNLYNTAGITLVNATQDSLIDNTLTFTSTSNFGQVRNSFVGVEGHVFYCAIQAKSATTGAFMDIYNNNTGDQVASKAHTGTNKFQIVDLVLTTPDSAPYQLRYLETSSSRTSSVKKFVAVNLTKAFGIGNEPTLAEFRAIYSLVTAGDMFAENANAETYAPLVTGADKDKPYYVHVEDGELTVIQKYTDALDIKFVWRLFYPNYIFNMNQIFFIPNTNKNVSSNYRGGNLLDTINGDTLGPYQVQALTNIDGDLLGTSHFTGGSHGYDNISTVQPTNTPTARNDRLAFYIGGREVTFFSGYTDKVDVRWRNFIQANNTKKFDGSGREVLKEEYHMVYEGGLCKVSNRVEFLEPVRVVQYYGIQGFDRGLYRGGVYYHSSAQTKEQPSLVASDSVDRNCDIISFGRDANRFDMILDRTTGMGTGKYLNTVAYNAFYTLAIKAYFYLIDDETFTEGEVVTYKGAYNYYNDSTLLP